MSTEKKSTQFWKQVSSGLRTTLNVIKGTADIAQNEIYDIDSVREGFRKIEGSTDYLLDVVNDIVDYVTIEINDLKIQHSLFNIDHLIHSVIVKYFNISKREKKYFDTQIHGIIHEKLLGDASRVEQILECMLSNAFKYTTEKDQLYFRIFETGNTGDKVSIRFSLTSTTSAIYEKLTDTVNGKVVTDATDLLLYNCHYILKKMGGQIKVILDDDGFSVIVIDMELGIPEEEQKIQSDLFADDNILIICDNRKEAEERGYILSEMNVSYDIATEEEEALDSIGEAEMKKKPYTLCVIDWNIKSFDVQELVNEIHNIFGREMPIVAMAYNTNKLEMAARKIGFDYIMKKTWFRSTIFEVLLKNKNGELKKWDQDQIQEKQYDFSEKRILVAEDAPMNQELILRILENVHAEVVCAANGLEAYTIYKQKPSGYFQCILMDVNMPEMNGYEATKRIRKSEKKDAGLIPIYALTANAFHTDILEALNSGMDGHFSKPINVDTLYQTLEKVFAEVDEGTYDYRKKGKDLAKEQEKYLYKSGVDPMTGLLNSYGFEKELKTKRYVNRPIGFLLMEINHWETIKKVYDKEKIESLLIKIVCCLRDNFRTTDLLIRQGESCFSIVINYCDGDIEFIKRKTAEMNTRLSELSDEITDISISVGASYSTNGYSSSLYDLAEEALYQAKETKEHCVITEDQMKHDPRERIGDLFNKSVFGTEMFYLEMESISQVDRVEELLSLILGNNQAVGILCGTYEDDLPICSISGFALKNLGYEFSDFKEETNGKLTDILYPEDIDLLYNHAQDHELEVRKLRFIHKNGDILWFNAAYVSTVNSDGKKMWIASLRPFDENIVGSLCNMDFQMISVIFHKENMILFEKGQEKIHNVNLKLRKKYNYETLMKNVVSRLHRKEEREDFISDTCIHHLTEQLDNKGIYEAIYYEKKEDGEYTPVRYKYRYLDEAKDVILWTQESVESFAERDDITSLFNENGFYRNAKKTICAERNTEKAYAILYVNIKDFKSWNEILGHSTADELLRKCANLIDLSKLQPVCGARFRADKFWYLIEKEDMDYDELIHLCHSKLRVNGNLITVHLSCGIYEIDDCTQDISIMCDKAVIAADNISNEYATPYYIYDDTVNKRYQNRVFVLNNLDRAFNRNEFQVYYQPVCDTKTKKICSSEALVRWIMSGGKVVSPGDFVPVLENKGFISKLDLFVSDRVEQFLESRIFDNKKAVPVSINLSRMDFLSEEFLKELHQRILEIKIDQSYFRYEVTESAYIGVGDDGKKLLAELRKKKSKIYIDDFGTGYSSLQNLMEIKFDILKIDMYFVRRIGFCAISEGIIDSAIRICHSLGNKVIAEGVETEEQYQFLLEKECDYIQGYYFYKPLPEHEFAELLDND